MSWSLSAGPVEAGVQGYDVLDAAAASYIAERPGLDIETTRQLRAAVEAAKELLDAHHDVGHSLVQVSLGGHANPGGLAPEGWSEDYITVSVSRAKDPDPGEEPLAGA